MKLLREKHMLSEEVRQEMTITSISKLPKDKIKTSTDKVDLSKQAARLAHHTALGNEIGRKKRERKIIETL